MDLFIAAILILILMKIYFVATTGVCRSKKSMDGKTVIVTGANRGIGLEVARDLAKRKARVILACRDVVKAHEAAGKIRASVGTCDLVVRHIDLSSMRSVRQFANEITVNEERLDVLIHNAAFLPSQGRFLTEDNLELQFATNHLGPFLLTHLLLDLLKRSAPSRIVVTSSMFHIFATLDFENLNLEKYERRNINVYNSTKLANILFVRELGKRLEGTNVTVNALHPGAVYTDLSVRVSNPILYHVVRAIASFYLKSTRSGAQTTLYLAVSEDVEGVSGKYFSDCRQAWTSRSARNDEYAKKLWEISEKLLTKTENGTVQTEKKNKTHHKRQ